MFNLVLMCSMLSMLSRFLVMRGHRLRIARVGEIRRCWASSLVLDKDKEVLFQECSTEDGGSVEEDATADEDVVWTTPTKLLPGNGDPLLGLRHLGSTSQFWSNGEEHTTLRDINAGVFLDGVSGQDCDGGGVL